MTGHAGTALAMSKLGHAWAKCWALILALFWIAAAQAADPIKIGFSTSLTGGLASSGKANLLAQQIWQDEINAQGGLLGRQVDLVYYDDQSNASRCPASTPNSSMSTKSIC